MISTVIHYLFFCISVMHVLSLLDPNFCIRSGLSSFTERFNLRGPLSLIGPYYTTHARKMSGRLEITPGVKRRGRWPLRISIWGDPRKLGNQRSLKTLPSFGPALFWHLPYLFSMSRARLLNCLFSAGFVESCMCSFTSLSVTLTTVV